MMDLIVISGPTASGKTEIAIQLCKELDAEIISADSMQIYKYMNIGTAKPTQEERQGIRHHLLDVLEPDQDFSVAVFKQMATEAIQSIHRANKIPIVVGGTGFFINALVYNNDFTETKIDPAFRNQLEKIAQTKGNLYLHEQLRKVDVQSADAIHYNNVKRVIRALEYYQQTQTSIAEHNQLEKKRKPFYRTTTFILNQDRNRLYERINQRVDRMIEQGLVREVQSLLEMGFGENLVSMQGIGYKEVVKYLDSKISLAESVDSIKQNTRRYAKRQITWFKHQSEGFWINIDESQNQGIMIETMKKLLDSEMKL